MIPSSEARSGAEPRLAPPPRRVPPSLAVRTLLLPGLLAWLWVAFGSSAATAFLLNTDLTSWARFRGPLTSIRGTATACEKTGASEGGGQGERGTSIYATRYRFDEGGGTREAVSYAKGRCAEPGAEVVVEHPPGRPEVSRIEGMRRAVFGPEVALILIFPLAGVVFVVVTLRIGWRELRLLRRGKLAPAAVVADEPTGASRRILYDPERPERAIPWDLLRCAPGVDATGALLPSRTAMVLLAVVPPLLALVGHAVALKFGRL